MSLSLAVGIGVVVGIDVVVDIDAMCHVNVIPLAAYYLTHNFFLILVFPQVDGMMLLTDNLKDLSFERAPLHGGIKVNKSPKMRVIHLSLSVVNNPKCASFIFRSSWGISKYHTYQIIETIETRNEEEHHRMGHRRTYRVSHKK